MITGYDERGNRIWQHEKDVPHDDEARAHKIVVRVGSTTKVVKDRSGRVS